MKQKNNQSIQTVSHSTESITNISSNNPVFIRSTTWFFIIGIIFVAANMRGPITSVGPLVGIIRDDLLISNTLAGFITTLPLLAFALFSPIVPSLSRKFGLEKVIFFSMIGLALGIFLRSSSGATMLFLGTAILGLAISVANVLLPSLIKRDFSNRIGMMTGVYSISMNIVGATASGVSIPLALNLGFGWQGALSIWGILAILAILLWFPQMSRNRTNAKLIPAVHTTNKVNLWRSKLAWQVTLFMGLQSMIFYILIAWLPEILIYQGVNINQSGYLLSILQLALLPFTFIVPILAGKMTDQRPLVFIMAGLLFIGTTGLIYGSSNLNLLWIIALGVGGGFAFGLSMMFFSLRTNTALEAAKLSGMAQSIGYLLAATGPSLFGLVHDLTKSWSIPLFILFIASILLFVFGLGAAKNKFVT